jgi:hypothetical protein
MDPFDAPMDARVYVDYRNNSDRPVAAVKFRLRFVDAQNRDRGTFHAVDMVMVAPGGNHSIKAKRDFTLHPSVIGIKARVLQVKYADGTDWTSVKMQELAQPPGASGSGGPAPGPSDSPAPPPEPAASQPAPAAAPAPAATTSVYGNTQHAPNPRQYENPPAAAGGTVGQAYDMGLIQGAAPVQAVQPSPVVDSFAGGTASPGQVPNAPAQSSANPVGNDPSRSAAGPAARPVASPAQSPAANPAAGSASGSQANPGGGPGQNLPANPAAALGANPPANPQANPANQGAGTGPNSGNAPATSAAPVAPNGPVDSANPYPIRRYQGVQPVNVPYSPENDK